MRLPLQGVKIGLRIVIKGAVPAHITGSQQPKIWPIAEGPRATVAPTDINSRVGLRL